MALDRNREALVFIKQALAIKHNKTLYKYLIELENKCKSFKTITFKNGLDTKDENFNRTGVNNVNLRKLSHVENKEEYRKIFDCNTSQSSNYYQQDNFNNDGKFFYF